MRFECPVVPTSGAIARALNCGLFKVLWIIRTRGILPIAKAGNSNIYSPGDAQRIADELGKIDEARKLRSQR